jgi:hypothetical protein
MERAVWVWQFNQLGEQTVDQIAETLVPRGITRVYAKAMDGTVWMSDVYSHPMVPSSAVRLAQLNEQFRQVGLQLIPWVVNRHVATEAPAHIACAQACGGVVVDFEYGYDGFWEGTEEQAQAYFDQLRAAVGPNLWVAAAPDARQVGRDYSADLIAGLSAYLPQNYWTDFKRPWDGVMQQGCTRCQPIGPVEPILPSNATVDDIRACVRWCEQQGFGAASLWRMGPANAADLDAFGTTAAVQPQVAAQAVSDLSIPQQYRDRGWDTWPAIAENLEGIIRQLMAERDDALARVARTPPGRV